MMTVILLFNLVSVLTEFTYYGGSQCGLIKPKYLPLSRASIPQPYQDYLKKLSFFSGLGLLFNFAFIGVSIFLSYKEIKHRNYIVNLPLIFIPRLRRTFLLVTFLSGSIPLLLMPLYTYNYLLCQTRNSVFLKAGFPVYFSLFLISLIFFALIGECSIFILLKVMAWLRHRNNKGAEKQKTVENQS